MRIPICIRVLILLVAASVTACILFPVVWSVVTNVDWLDYPPARVFRRVWMISVLVGLILFRKQIELQHPASVGFGLSKAGFYHLSAGLAVVVFFLLTLASFYGALDAWKLDVQSHRLPKMIWLGFLRGAIVAGIEEYVFRGLLFVSLAKRWGWVRSAIMTSMIFSTLHFLEGYGIKEIENPAAWTAGFVLCGRMLSNMAAEFTLFPNAFGLFVVGFILCYGVVRTGSLWYSAGLHGGWIWGATVIHYIWDTTGVYDRFFIGGVRLFDGVFPIVGMLVIFPITHLILRWKVLKTTAPIARESGQTETNRSYYG
ncbi:MAG: CPBP family intramembrane metalloprotease [Candidatus Omnitrophota bacterium]|jgi:membrane protease YdiL (CAAX protease family)|nr:MAG: CPBP family intramembrane metalloprotease [Candidatus Omnitrophota bacterium]